MPRLDADPLAETAARLPSAVRGTIGFIETAIYLVAGVLLVVAAGLVIAGTAGDALWPDEGRGTIGLAILVLDRILLIFIIAELLFTLRLTIARGEILVEPFLFIGLIAVVRRVLVITAEAEGAASGGVLRNFLLELGVLALLALALAIAIHLLRRSPAPSEIELTG